MINRTLWQMTHDNVVKQAFIPAEAQQGMAPPPAQYPEDPAAGGGALPPQDPLAAQGGMPPPADMMAAAGAAPVDPAAAAAAPPPAEAAPPPMDPTMSALMQPTGGDVKSQVMQALTEAGVVKTPGSGKGGKGKGGDMAALEVQSRRTNKLLTSLHAALGAPLPYDILDDGPPVDASGSGVGGAGDSGGSTPKQAVSRGAIQPVSGIQPAFDAPKVAEHADALIQLLRDNVR